MTKVLIEPFGVKKTSNIKVDVQVVFGVLSQKCASSGICRVFVLPEQHVEANCTCEHQARAQFLYDPEQGKIGLAFDFSFANTKEWKTFFADFSFRVDEDWWTTPALNSRLNTSIPLQIAKGTYSVFITEEGIRVWFLEEHNVWLFLDNKPNDHS